MAVTDIIGHQIIDLTNDANYYFEVAPQGDSQSRYVEVRLLNSGAVYPIDTGSTVIIEGKNAGGYNIFNSCSLSQEYNNGIIIPLKNGILSFAGVGKYQVVIYNGDEYVTSFPFNIVVTEAPYDIERLQGSDSYEALNMAIAQALSANRWWVENGLPTVTVPEGFNKGDYYLDALTGNIYIADYNASQVVAWRPVTDSSGRQINIISKLYVRYANNASGDGMSTSPSDKLYIGFYNCLNGDPNDKDNYQWSLMRTFIDMANTVTKYAQTSTTIAPAPSAYSTTMPTTLISGGYLWTKVHLAFLDGTSTEYVTMNKNGRGIDHVEVTKDEGQQSLGEKAFRFVFDYVLVIPTGSENPQSLGWYVYNGSNYVLTTDTTVVAGTNYYTKGDTTRSISVYNGEAAGFGAPTATMNDGGAPQGAPSVTVTADASSPDTAKIFEFGFKVRGAEWKTGSLISGTVSTQTSTVLNSSNTIIGDLYLNTLTSGSAGKIYICTNVTNSNSTWEDTGFVISLISNISDLKDTRRFYGALAAGEKTLTITDTSLPLLEYNSADAASNNVDYRVRVLSTDPDLVLVKNPVVTISDDGVNGSISISLEYKEAPTSNKTVCVEVIKKILS